MVWVGWDRSGAAGAGNCRGPRAEQSRGCAAGRPRGRAGSGRAGCAVGVGGGPSAKSVRVWPRRWPWVAMWVTHGHRPCRLGPLPRPGRLRRPGVASHRHHLTQGV